MRLGRDWAAHPPKLIWKIPVGAGWSGFAIDRGLAITQEQRGGQEMVVAYDFLTGAPRWSHGDAIRYDSVIAGDGPRATPTIAGAFVATLGSTGRLNVLDFRTGRRLWSKDIAADNQAANPEWGRSGSPLVLDGKVIVERRRWRGQVAGGLRRAHGDARVEWRVRRRGLCLADRIDACWAGRRS